MRRVRFRSAKLAGVRWFMSSFCVLACPRDSSVASALLRRILFRKFA